MNIGAEKELLEKPQVIMPDHFDLRGLQDYMDSNEPSQNQILKIIGMRNQLKYDFLNQGINQMQSLNYYSVSNNTQNPELSKKQGLNPNNNLIGQPRINLGGVSNNENQISNMNINSSNSILNRLQNNGNQILNNNSNQNNQQQNTGTNGNISTSNNGPRKEEKRTSTNQLNKDQNNNINNNKKKKD